MQNQLRQSERDMKPWNLSAALQEGCLYLQRHPAILLSAATSLFIFLFYMTRNRNKIFINWPVIGMLPTIIANYDLLLDHLTAHLRECNHTFMFRGPWFTGMNFLITCDPENANHIFNVHFANYPKGDGFLEIFDIFGNGIFGVDGESWMSQRRMAHAQMNSQWFRSSVGERSRDKVAKVLLPLMDHMAEFDKVLDLNEIFTRFMFDITCDLVLGVDPELLAAESSTIPFAKALDQIEQVLLFRHTVPMLWWKLLRRMRVGKEKDMAEATEEVDRFIAQCIQDRRVNKKLDEESNNMNEGPISLLAPYIEFSDDKFLRDTLFTFLSAGKDTTGAALFWLFWLVSNHRAVEAKILEELRQLRTQPGTKDDDMTVFGAEETDSLIYLQAVMYETLRLYPSVPFNHKETLQADILPSGHRVQSGMKIIFCTYATGRMEGIWGKDCLEFKPERWITEKGTLRHEPSYKFIAFHSGPRSCLGKSMACTLIKVVAAAVIYNFNVQVVEGHVAEPKISIVIQARNGLLVRLKKRKIKGH